MCVKMDYRSTTALRNGIFVCVCVSFVHLYHACVAARCVSVLTSLSLFAAVMMSCCGQKASSLFCIPVLTDRACVCVGVVKGGGRIQNEQASKREREKKN